MKISIELAFSIYMDEKSLLLYPFNGLISTLDVRYTFGSSSDMNCEGLTV